MLPHEVLSTVLQTNRISSTSVFAVELPKSIAPENELTSRQIMNNSVAKSQIQYQCMHVFFFVSLVCLAIGWYADHERLMQELLAKSQSIAIFGEKFDLCSPAAYIDLNYAELEHEISHRATQFQGDIVQSSQGIVKSRIRRPTIATFREVLLVLDDPSPNVRTAAIQLIALYLEGLSTPTSDNAARIEIAVLLQGELRVKSTQLLGDPIPEIRRAAALIIGNCDYDFLAMSAIKRAFETEQDDSARHCLAWAHWTIVHSKGTLHL